jgi:hypothetical protein
MLYCTIFTRLQSGLQHCSFAGVKYFQVQSDQDVTQPGYPELMESTRNRTPCPGQKKGHNRNIRNFPFAGGEKRKCPFESSSEVTRTVSYKTTKGGH